MLVTFVITDNVEGYFIFYPKEENTFFSIMKIIRGFVELDRIFTDCFPKEINKAKIKEIFEILHSQRRPDLVKEMKNLVLLKTNGKNGLKLADEEKTHLSQFSGERNIGHLMNKVLPSEMLVKILKKLDLKSLSFAKQTCMRWRDIIHEFELVEKASSKFLKF